MVTRRSARPGALSSLSPVKILTQIVILQSAFYTIATALILFTILAAGKSFSLDLLLDWRSLRGDTTVGWTLGLCWGLTSLAGYAQSHSYGLRGVEVYKTRGGLAEEENSKETS